MKNILIIDEDAFFIASISYFLENEGYNITACSNGSSGLSMLDKENYHLVICSTQLRLNNGYEVAKQMKTNSSTCHIPIMLISPSSSIVSVNLDEDIYYDAYIQKPVMFVPLLEKIHKLVKERALAN